VHLLELVLFLLLCAVVLGWLAKRAQIPYPIALVLGGSALGFVPGLPELDFNPQLVLVLVLPPILYQAALLTSWRDFKANLRPIGMLAIGLVIVTTLAVGAALKFLVPDIPWAVAFAFGAIVSPPDAVAATAVLSHLHMPRRIVTVLEGESLVNDASGLVLYKFAVAAALTGAFSLGGASVEFVWVSLAGIAIGIVLAWIFVQVHGWLKDPFTEVLLALSIPYVAYIAAESLHVSGVLAVVAAGLFRGRHSPKIVSAEMRILARSMWNVLVFLLNSLIFILIGIQVSVIVGRIPGFTPGQLALYGITVSVVAVAVRFLWVYLTSFGYHWLRELPQADGESKAPREADQLFIISWCGMRGIVSLAAALALPATLENGAPFPYRDLVIFLTFAVIVVTLVAQGLTLGPLIRHVGLGTDLTSGTETRHARAEMGRAALAAIDQHAQEQSIDPRLAGRLRDEFAEKIAETGEEVTVASSGTAEQARALRREAIRAERSALIRVWEADQISDEVLRELEEELDYQESRL
jgi:Na+/H+ antiporter